MPTEKLPTRNNTRIRRATAGAAITLASLAGVGLANRVQTVEGQPLANSEVAAARQEYAAGRDYIKNPDRNTRIESRAAQAAGAIIDRAQKNPENFTFEGQVNLSGVKDRDGRGRLSTSINKDGKKYEFEATVVRDGSSYRLDPADTEVRMSASRDVPGKPNLLAWEGLTYYLSAQEPTWSAERGKGVADTTTEFGGTHTGEGSGPGAIDLHSYGNPSPEQLQSIEERVNADAGRFIREAGL